MHTQRMEKCQFNKCSSKMGVESNALFGRLPVSSLPGTGLPHIHFEKLWSTGKGLKRTTVKVRVLGVTLYRNNPKKYRQI